MEQVEHSHVGPLDYNLDLLFGLECEPHVRWCQLGLMIDERNCSYQWKNENYCGLGPIGKLAYRTPYPETRVFV